MDLVLPTVEVLVVFAGLLQGRRELSEQFRLRVLFRGAIQVLLLRLDDQAAIVESQGEMVSISGHIKSKDLGGHLDFVLHLELIALLTAYTEELELSVQASRDDSSLASIVMDLHAWFLKGIEIVQSSDLVV